MKRPEYVAAAVSACRHAADGEPVPPALLEDLGAVFSRSGFTDGYLSAQRGRGMFGIRTKEDVEGASSAVFASLHALYKNERQCVPVTFRARIFEGEHPALTVSDGAHTASVADEAHVCAAAQRLPVETARWQAQLQKTGGTPYRCTAAEIETDGRTAVPVSVLNGLRRAALRGARCTAQGEKAGSVPDAGAGRARTGLKARAARRVPRRGADLGKRRRARSGQLPLDTPLDALDALRRAGHALILEIPRAIWGVEAPVRARMEALRREGFTHFWCGNLDAVALCRELEVSAHGGFSLNVFNTQSLRFFESLGLCDTELSMELTGAEIAALGGALPRGVLVYGRQPLMLTRNCPLANSKKGCLHCARPLSIRDRRGVEFPVLCTKFAGKPVFSEVFNSVPLTITDSVRAGSGADFGVLRFSVEKAVETGKSCAAHPG